MPQGSNEGANSPLSPVSGAPTEVPTDCERDDASREGDLAEEPTLVPELHATVPDSLSASGVGEVPSPDLPTSAAGSRLLLNRAYRYLVDQGFGPLELASLDLDESTAMARQLATELNLPFGDWLVDALYCWLQEAREEAKIYKRAHGYHSGDLAWMSLMPPVELPDAKGVGPAFATEPPPPLGERNRKLIEDGCIVQAREERLLDIWCRKLRDELLLINAPVLASLQGSLDPDRAALLLTGSLDAKTLPGLLPTVATVARRGKAKTAAGVDYLLARRDEPCGRSAPEAILKAIAWVERVAEFEETLRATHGRLAWAAKDKITEILSKKARLIKRAARYPVFMLTLLEALVIDVGHATGLGQASQGLGLATVVRPASHHIRGAFASGGEAHHRAKTNQNFGPQPSGKGAAGRYIRARLVSICCEPTLTTSGTTSSRG